jgi:hypothetical protein
MFESVGLPHGFCSPWNPELLFLDVLSDSLLALAYFLIPVALIRIVRRRKDIPFNAIFFCFAAFIVACGTLPTSASRSHGRGDASAQEIGPASN